MTDETLRRYPRIHARLQGAKPAVVMAETGAALSYGELEVFANRLARLYRSLGLKPGDHIAYCLENRLECPAVQWGAHYAGLYYTFISTRLTIAEAIYIVQDCDAKVLVVSSKTAAGLAEAARRMPNPPRIYTLDEDTELPSLAAAMNPFEAAPIEDAEEGSEMLYSSGTTGRPKGIVPQLTRLPLGSTLLIADFLQQGFGMDDATIYLSPAPYYHTSPMKWAQGVTAFGGTAVIMARFDAENFLRFIEQYKVTHSQVVPTMYHRLLSLPAQVKTTYDLSSHKMSVHAAAPCPIPIKQAMIDWWGPILVEYYGATEGHGLTVTDSAAWLAHPGTVGRSIYGKIHIVGEDGKELSVGHEGLIYFSGTRRFVYHKDPAKTAEAYTVDGWATTGDIGRLDSEGYLYLTDRKSNMIITGGVNVYPQETENVLLTHPKVFDVAVIGTPHDDLGEEVRAVIQLQPSVEPGAELAQELIDFCRRELSHIKCPRVVDFRDSLPREPNGKLLKRLLRDEYRARMSPTASNRPSLR